MHNLFASPCEANVFILHELAIRELRCESSVFSLEKAYTEGTGAVRSEGQGHWDIFVVDPHLIRLSGALLV